MALKTRIRLLTFTKFAVLVLTMVVLLTSVSMVSAGDAPPGSTGMMWQMIMALFGMLDTVLTGIIVWLVSNQRETFQRIGRLESGEDVRAALCDERHGNNKRGSA